MYGSTPDQYWRPDVPAIDLFAARPYSGKRRGKAPEWAPVAEFPSGEKLTFRPPRPHGARVRRLLVYIAGMVAATVAIGVVAAVVVLLRMEPGAYADHAQFRVAYDQEFAPMRPWLFVIAAVPLPALLAILAPRAGYRRRDFLFVLVPVWGWVVTGRLLWRWTDIKHWNTERSAPAAQAWQPTFSWS